MNGFCEKFFEYDVLGSTNEEARRLIPENPEGFAVYAACQTAGKGNAGHSFYSERGGMYLSVCPAAGRVPPFQPAVLAAVAARCAVERVCGARCGIKWVNDLYLSGKKVCGILCVSTGGRIIFGIGINAAQERFPDGLENAASLAQLGFSAEPRRLADTVIEELAVLSDPERAAAAVRYYRENNLIFSRPVPVRGTECAALRIEADCRLAVRAPGGETLYISSAALINP